MAVSGVLWTPFNNLRVIDESIRRCGLSASKVTPEIQQIALNNLNLMLSSLATENNPLWGLQRMLVPLQQGLAAVPMPDGTIDIRYANIRQTTRLEGTYASSAGGTADLAFDDDFDTSCTQVAPAGNISMVMDDETTVGVVGVMTNGDLTGTLTFQYSQDGGATWQTALAPGEQDYTDRVWKWYDLDPVVQCDAFRVVAGAAVTLNLREFYIGNNPSSIPMARINIDDYMSFPNKQFPGRPLQYWADLQRDTPIMRIWPVTDEGSRNQQIETMLKRYLYDAGTLRDTLDVPKKWYEAIVWNLAWRVGVGLPEELMTDEIGKRIVQIVKPMAEQAWALIYAQESDDSPVKIAPNLHPYTA